MFSHWDAAGCGPQDLLDAGFEPHVLALLWCWDASVELYCDAGFEPRVLALQWCWDASFKPRVLALQWCFRASRLDTTSMISISLASEVWALHLMTCLQWFLDSLQGAIALPSFHSDVSNFTLSHLVVVDSNKTIAQKRQLLSPSNPPIISLTHTS